MPRTPLHTIRTRVPSLLAVAVLVAVLGLSASLLGCRQAQPDRMPDGRIPVRVFILLISTAQVEFYEWAEQTFEEQNPDLDVIIEQFPGSSLKDFEIKLRLRFSSGQAPDLFHVHENIAAELAALDLLVPAPPFIVERIEENSLNELVETGGRFDGTYYGLVSDGVWSALYYNKGMFREAGLDPERPPRTWAELVEYADLLTVRDADGEPIRAGLSLRKSGFKAGTAEKWMTFLYSAGGEAFAEDGTHATFDSEAGRAALDLYHTVLFDRKIDSVEHEGDQQGFGQGRVAMFVREPHVMSWLRDNYPDLDFGVAPIPRRDTSLSSAGTYLLAVSDDSPNPDAAWRFADFLLSDPSYARYTSAAGVVPTTESVASLPRYAEDPKMQVFLDQPAKGTGGFPRASRAADILGAYIERFAYGHLDAETMLELATRDVNAVLAPNRRLKDEEVAASSSPTSPTD
jgi:multiple sugar transport system substrate-binding protein